MSIVASDAHGPLLLRLSEGLAWRRPEGFRYMCPALWGDDAVAPVQALAADTVVIGASHGLYVMRADGAVAPHADPDAAGRVIALAASGAALFALRERDARFELLAVRPGEVDVLRSDGQPWADLAAGDAFVSLMRLEERRLYELRLSAQGEPLSASDAELPSAARDVRVRVAGADSYAVLFSSTLSAELGRIERGAWRSLLSAQTIAGPIELAHGERFVARDGALARFDGEQFALSAEPARISCLGRAGELRYACADNGLRPLEVDGPGAVLFALDDLLEPDLARVPEAQREACTLQWLRFRVDLLQVGVTPRTLDADTERAPEDASVAKAPVDAGVADAEVPATEAARADADGEAEPPAAPVGEEREGAGAAPEPEAEPTSGASERDDPPATRARAGSGCRLSTAPAGAAWTAGALALVFALRRARRRRRAS